MSVPDSAQDFLVMESGDLTFLVNRNQFSSSLYIENCNPREKKIRYSFDTINYGGKTILLLDFFSHLQSLFNYRSTESAHLALVVPVSDLSRKVSDIIHSLKGNGEISKEYIALRVSSQSSIEHIHISSLRPLPRLLREIGLNGGILGLRFVSTQHVQYFIDLDEMIARMLEGML